MQRKVYFLLNLLQDVNILRPLIILSSKIEKSNPTIILSKAFIARDTTKIWQNEVSEIVLNTRSLVLQVEDEFDALSLFEGNGGIVFAASESNLSPHKFTHNIFRMLNSDYLTVTLQHGFECVGFSQSVQHNLSYGSNVYWAADVVCAWTDIENLTSLSAHQSQKILPFGPTFALNDIPSSERSVESMGLVCENLHSVRMTASGDLKNEFMETFESFCIAMNQRKERVTLRPHPGGQYVLKNKVKLPKNAVLNNEPIYKVDLSSFTYGVSAPSSIIIDMLYAKIPVAVWIDEQGVMDYSKYKGLETISNCKELELFASRAQSNPEYFLRKQEVFLQNSGLILDTESVARNFTTLIVNSLENNCALKEPSAEKVLFIANDIIPTLQLSFIKPLRPLVEKGELASDYLTEKELKEEFGNLARATIAQRYILNRLEKYRPTKIIFCRYSGPHAVVIRLWALQNQVPVMFHIDDDLLNVPLSLGKAKFEQHNSPARVKTVRYLLDHSDLVYCSTKPLLDKLKAQNVNNRMISGDIYCSADVAVPAKKRRATKLGYMGFDHSHDLEIVLDVIVRILNEFPDTTFSMFGTIPKPKKLEEFGDRIIMIEPVRDYKLFLETFASLGWDIGICPLVVDEFNKVKANTKWVEYTSIGAAVVATKNTVYDECGADGCAILAENSLQWYEALRTLIEEPELHFEQLQKAQQKLRSSYSVNRLTDQVLSVFEQLTEC